MTAVANLADELAAESARLDAEAKEIDLLVTQARTESGRHETRRAAAAEKLAAHGLLVVGPRGDRSRQPGGDAHPARGAHGCPGRDPGGQEEGAPPPEGVDRRPRHPRPRGRRRSRRGRRLRGRGRRAAGQVASATAEDAGDGARGGPGHPHRPGGPPARDRAGDARWTRPEPDEHRAPGRDRRAARGQGPGRCRGRGPPARRDGPADARGDEDVHLRRPADGPRRPRPGTHPAPCRSRPRSPGRALPSSSSRSGWTGDCRWSSRAACSGSSTRRSPATSPLDRSGSCSGWTGATAWRRSYRPDARPSTCRPRTFRPRMDRSRRRSPRWSRSGAPATSPPWRRRAMRRSCGFQPKTWRDLSGRAASLGIAAELLDEGGRLRLVAALPRSEDDEPARAAAPSGG